MAITLEKAALVFTETVEALKGYFPSRLYGDVSKLDPKKVIQILSVTDYQKVFSDYYRNFFAASNATIFGKGGTKDSKWTVPSHAVVADSASFGENSSALATNLGTSTSQGPGSWLSTCPAFTSPAFEVVNRKIYIKEDPTTLIGTVYHETVHFLQHGNFYPEFYSLGGKNPFIMEGVTEYFTREISTAVASDRASQKKYDAQLQQILSWKGTDPMKTQILVNLNFLGQYTPLGLGETTVAGSTNVPKKK